MQELRGGAIEGGVVQIKTGVVGMVQDEVPATSCADSSLDLLCKYSRNSYW